LRLFSGWHWSSMRQSAEPSLSGSTRVTVTGPPGQAMPAIDRRSTRSQKALRAVRGPDGTGDTVELKRIDDPKQTGAGASRSVDRTIAPHSAG
jgi:hypothetical protein